MIPRLHLITDDSILARPHFLTRAREVMAAGGERLAFHLRGPGLEGRKVFELAHALREDARGAGTLLLVNDRLDVVLSLDLPGAHLGQRSLPPGVARGLLGPDRALGLSVHSQEEGEEAREGEVDFILVGTLFATLSNSGGIPGGIPRLLEIAATDPPLMIGIGGITPDRVEEVMVAGSHGVAVRGGVWDAPDPPQAVGVYLNELRRFSPGP